MLPAALPPSPVRLWLYNPWAGAPQPARQFIETLPGADLRPLVSAPENPALMRLARLDADWHAENARCLDALRHPDIEFLPARVVGTSGLAGLVGAFADRVSDETGWLVFTGQHPAVVPGGAAARVARFVRQHGGRVLFYAFDEASRTMPGFAGLAPHLDALIHDEHPLNPSQAALLPQACVTVHRSWVANVVPFSVPFNETPEPTIVFLGSQAGLTPHRTRQLNYLRKRFPDRLVALHDHSVDVPARAGLNRHRVAFCPEGRKFATPAMCRSHTDRPFWSGCLGLVPVSENSVAGDRLTDLADAGLIVSYPHGNLAALGDACERALALPDTERRRIYDHFNRHETVGAVVADTIAATTKDALRMTHDNTQPPSMPLRRCA